MCLLRPKVFLDIFWPGPD